MVKCELPSVRVEEASGILVDEKIFIWCANVVMISECSESLHAQYAMYIHIGYLFNKGSHIVQPTNPFSY